ncbi:MAG: DUF4392 domain-containing protein [Phycisphaerales bacterium]|nr:MAG: DUF4392 domain-containing protein [Phycisphaerales bacterium]
MNARIASIENLIATDPGSRNVFGLVVADQLRLAAQSLRLAKRVGIVSGFFIPEAGAGETDGPPGALVIGAALTQLGIPVDYITDRRNAGLFRALGLDPLVDALDYLDVANPSHLLAIERVGRGADGRYRNMRGVDITEVTPPLDELFLQASQRGLTTIGIGDGGNEVGMGRVFGDVLDTADPTMAIEHGAGSATTVSTDFCIAAGVSNWGAYGLAGAISVLEGRDLLPSASDATRDVERLVSKGGAVDGVTHRREPTVDGMDISHSVRMLENIRGLIAPSPFADSRELLVGILGYGESGQAVARLLAEKGHRVCLSDRDKVMLGTPAVWAGVETGGHTIGFLSQCDLVVASPGVRPDAAIRDELHIRGIPVMSELECAFQLCDRELIAVTGTVGKRTTVELLQRLFGLAGQPLTIGGNRGRPLSALLMDEDVGCGPAAATPIAVAVSSFQLETVVHFGPHIAIVLNIAEEHLDRHRSVGEYVRTKSRIFMNHRPDDILILTFDDPHLRPLSRKHQGRTFFVSSQQSVDRGAWLANGVVRVNLGNGIEDIGPADPASPENLLASIVTARLCGISAEQTALAVATLGTVGQV